MLNISHLQAQRLIRQSLDRPLPEEQWAALQAHLEDCPTCRAYRARQSLLEKDLRRALGRHWRPVAGPLHVPESVKMARERRARRAALVRQGAKLAGAGLALFAIGWLYLLLHPPGPSGAPSITPTHQTTTTPNPSEAAFRGTVLYSEAVEAGASHDLFLLTGGPKGVDRVQLTGIGAAGNGGKAYGGDNIYPVWSADGEWIAFLSNRGDPALKRYDVYVMTVAGTRLTRLTDDPSLSYLGPLSWSADGRWIAGQAAYVEGTPQDLWIALVPVPGGAQGIGSTTNLPGGESSDTGARLLARSRGAGVLRFSPTGDRLAYLQDNQIKVLDIDRGSTTTAVVGSAAQAVDARFDWSPDGAGLVYRVEGSATQVRTISSTFLSQSTLSSEENPYRLDTLLVSDPHPNHWIYSPTWSPAGSVVYLQKTNEMDLCLSLRVVGIGNTGPHPVDSGQTPQFCGFLPQEQGLDRGNWSQKEGWLVLPGYDPTIAAEIPSSNPPFWPQIGYGIYALRAAWTGGTPGKPVLEKLEEARDLAGQPRVRPDGESLNLNPRAADGRTSRRPLIEMDPGALSTFNGQITGISRTNAASGELVTIRLGIDTDAPWGVRRNGVTWSGINLTCATIAPNGISWAFTGSLLNNPQGEVYVLSANDGNPRAITTPDQRWYSPTEQWIYGCPAWSPDGQRIAVAAQTNSYHVLFIIPDHASPADNGILVVKNAQRITTVPRWLPDGSAVLLGTQSTAEDPAAILRVDAATGSVSNLVLLDRYDTVGDLAVSQDGSKLAYLVLADNSLIINADREPYVSLCIAEIIGRVVEKIDLSSYDPRQGVPGYDFLHFRTSRSARLGYLFHGGPTALAKAGVELFPEQVTLAAIPDAVLAAAWSPDGDGLVFSTETGTYLIDLRKEDPKPVRVSDWVFDSLDWR